MEREETYETSIGKVAWASFVGTAITLYAVFLASVLLALDFKQSVDR